MSWWELWLGFLAFPVLGPLVRALPEVRLPGSRHGRWAMCAHCGGMAPLLADGRLVAHTDGRRPWYLCPVGKTTGPIIDFDAPAYR